MGLQAFRGSAFAVQERVDDSGHSIPRVLLFAERPASGRGQLVETRPAIRVGAAPAAGDQSSLLEAHQRRIQRAHVQVQRAVGHLLETARRPHSRGAGRAS